LAQFRGKADATLCANNGRPIILDHFGCSKFFHTRDRQMNAALQRFQSVGRLKNLIENVR
jgi:hypothetical protein